MTGQHVEPETRRIAYLTNIPSPYRVAMVRAWAERNPNLSISVFYTDADDQGRGWTTEPIGGRVVEKRLPILANIRKYGKLNRGLREMVRSNEVVMIGGFEQASYLAAALLARAVGKPVILLFDGFSPARFGTEPWPVLKLKKITARLSLAFFANGIVGRRYLTAQIGVSPTSIIYNQFLSHASDPIERARRKFAGMDKSSIRQKLNINSDGRRILMSCGYLIERKRVDLTISAIARMPENERPMLLVIGDGPLIEALRYQSAERGVMAQFVGFLQADELAEYYFAADALVLASSDDPWGLVLNEAMSAGLPVIASDACGAVLDLVKDGINGFAFATGSAESLKRAIVRLFRSDLESFGAASRSLIEDWTPAASAKNLGEILKEISKKRPAPMR